MLTISVQDKNTLAGAIFTYYVLLFMCNNWIFYFLFYLKLIKFELEQIKNYSLLFRSWDCEEIDLDILTNIRNQYQRAYEMTECVNIFFGCSQFAMILLTFYTLLTYMNFVYQQMDRQFEGHGLIFKL